MPIVLGLKLTAAGEAEFVNAVVEERTVDITQMVLGDANGAWYEVTGAEEALLNECDRIPLLAITNALGHPNRIICDAPLPVDVGGFTLREFGLLSSTGVLLAIGMHQIIELPAPGGPTVFDIVIRGMLDVLASDVVNMVIDPYVVTATRAYVDDAVDALAGTVAGTIATLPNPEPFSNMTILAQIHAITAAYN
ncbi:MAG: phage tail protein [Desulfuromonadaceae bacterium]|nr:phage tail protein [Desulfuromonadaceae bacterium]MDD5107547.1 phage tail protein [Desulfuromonadaceae bacterium]